MDGRDQGRDGLSDGCRAPALGSRHAVCRPAETNIQVHDCLLNTLVSALDTADAAPTTQQKTTFVEIEKALEEQLRAWAQLRSKDIPALNEQLKKAGLPAIDLEKPVPSSAGAAQTTSQDRDRNEE